MNINVKRCFLTNAVIYDNMYKGSYNNKTPMIRKSQHYVIKYIISLVIVSVL